MRILSGKHKNKIISTKAGRIKGNFRPIKSQVREALFSILENANFLDEDILHEARIADIFCGSGAFGLEAISRGAKFVSFIDINHDHLSIVKYNIAKLNEAQSSEFLCYNAMQLPVSRKPYDIIYLDPPYSFPHIKKILNELITKKWATHNTLIILETGKRHQITIEDILTIIDQRVYGITKLLFMKYRDLAILVDQE